MWVPSKTFELFSISKDTVDVLRSELAATRAENDLLKTQLLQAQTNFNWITVRVNALESERAALLNKVHGIQVAVPEIVRPAIGGTIPDFLNNPIFDDMSDTDARKLGLPTYDN